MLNVIAHIWRKVVPSSEVGCPDSVAHRYEIMFSTNFVQVKQALRFASAFVLA